MHRLHRLACRILGHRPPKLLSGRFEGAYWSVSVCPRCGHAFQLAAGTRRARRAEWRRQWKQT